MTPLRAVSQFDGLIFTIDDGPPAPMTAAPTRRSCPGRLEPRIIEWQRHLIVVRLPLIEFVVPPVHLSEVVILEVGVEDLEELIEGNHGLVGQLGEGEEIGIVVHVSEHRLYDADFAFPAQRRLADRVFHRAR